MSKLFYRFRSIEKLFQFQELETQTIYFASPKKLNDPMEGYKELLFQGDRKNFEALFRHYLLSLEHIISLYIIVGEKDIYKIKDEIPIFKTLNDFPTIQAKKIFTAIEKDFFSYCSKLITKIALRTTPVKKEEMIFYLDSVHFLAISIIQNHFKKYNFLSRTEKYIPINTITIENTISMIDIFEELLKEDEGNLKFDVMLHIQKNIQDSLIFSQSLNDKLFEKSPNRNFIFVDFVRSYVDSLENLMYPPWFTACFMSECNNSSVWGHYGDSHKGVCLIFQTDTNSMIFKDKTSLEFKQVNYTNQFIEIDFFKSIGRLPITKLYEMWNITFDEDENAWRKKHWKQFYTNILTKTKDWEYEKEYRLVLSSVLDDITEEEGKKLQYDFSSLKGLIFGIKTSMSDKVQIVEIIRKKCEENKRDDFEFYQADYSHKYKNIQYSKIGFLDFKV